jgi:hypothetical protein
MNSKWRTAGSNLKRNKKYFSEDLEIELEVTRSKSGLKIQDVFCIAHVADSISLQMRTLHPAVR